MKLSNRLMTGLALATIASFIASCQIPGSRTETVRPEGPLANFRAEPTGQRGTPIPVTIYLIANDGCVQPAWVRADVDETRRTVTLRGATKRVDIVGANCTAAVHYPSATATFTPQSVGTYTLKATIAVDPSAESNTGGYSHLQPKIELTRGGPDQVIEMTQTVEITE